MDIKYPFMGNVEENENANCCVSFAFKYIYQSGVYGCTGVRGYLFHGKDFFFLMNTFDIIQMPYAQCCFH